MTASMQAKDGTRFMAALATTPSWVVADLMICKAARAMIISKAAVIWTISVATQAMTR